MTGFNRFETRYSKQKNSRVASNSCQQPKGPKDTSGSSPEEIMFSPEFSSKLEEVSEHLAKHGICEGIGCDQLKVQKGGQPPHIKLDFANGVLRQKLIIAQSPDEITVEPEECVIFNDGTKSDGCSRPEFKAFVSGFEEGVAVLINGHLTKVLPVPTAQSGSESSIQDPVGPDKVPPFQAHFVVEPAVPNGSDGEKKQPEQLSEEDIPDSTKYAIKKLHLASPSLVDCKKIKKMNLQKFSSTWLSLSAKKISIKDHIDLDEKLLKKDSREPVCDPEFQSASLTDIDKLPGVQHRTSLQYSLEMGLKEVLLKLGNQEESLEEVGTRIAMALQKNTTSWVLTNIAALYWRVRGDAAKAIDCLRMAIDLSPPSAKDTSLLSLANVLHKSGYLNDAIAVMSYCLDVTPNLVIGHFNMANIYAAKGKWDYAAMFYESTLGLQSSFEAASLKLKAIQCMKVLQQPETKGA